MVKTMISAIVIVVLLFIFIYLVYWTIQYAAVQMEKKTVKKRKAVKEKQSSIKLRTIGCSKNYWYNQREAEDCPEGKPIESVYHYFESPQDCVKELLIEMYDCALVRTEELEKIAFGQAKAIDPKLLEIPDEYDDFDDFDYEEDEEEIEEEVEQIELTEEQRSKIYERWVSYVVRLYDMVSVNCNEEMTAEIRNAIMEYGHNPVEVLLHSPE